MKKIKILNFAPKRGGKCPKDKRGAEKAFTLAEILITLSIIGVVAALTIPTLIQRTGNEELVSRLHKAYSTLSQATEAIMTEQGSPTVWATSADNLFEAYKSHLRNAKDCGSLSGCFKSANGAGTAKVLYGADYLSPFNTRTDMRNLILSDGTSIAFLFQNTSCEGVGLADLYGINDRCSEIWVDINGSKKPNTMGRDIFGFGLKKTGLYPFGVDARNIEDVCSLTTANGKNGFGCAARVIAEGDMNY